MTSTTADRLRGVLTATLTPIDLQGDPALQHFPALLDFQRNAGIDGVVVCGTNGEAASLSVAERKRVLETAMAHRGSLTIIAGTGASSVSDAVELTRHAAEVGADAALVLPPFFFKNPTAEGLEAYFRPILDATSLPVLLYNIPQFTAVPITDALLQRLADHPNLAGIKDSAGDWARTLEFITCYPNLRIFSGGDRLAAQCFTHGGAGIISGGANAFPELYSAIRDAHLAEPASEAVDKAQKRLDAALDITTRYPFLSTSKAIQAHRGLPRLGVRPPLTVLSPSQERELISELTAAGFLPANI